MSPHAAGAQRTSIEIIDVTSYVPADGSFAVEIRIRPANLVQQNESFELAVTVFEQLNDQDSLDRALTRPLTRMEPVRLSDLPPRNDGRYRLEIPIRSGAQFDDQTRIRVPEAGVYPVSIDLRSDSGLWASTRTNMIRLSSDPDDDGSKATPLLLAVVLAVSPAEGLTVEEVTPLLSRYPNLPLTVYLQEGVMSQLSSDPTLLDRFARSVANRPVLAEPNLRLDPSALAEIGQGSLYQDVLTETHGQVRQLGLVPATEAAVVEARLTEGGARTLLDAGIKVVLSPDIVTASNSSLVVDGRSLDVVSVDGALTAFATEDGSGDARANRILAQLALRGSTDTTPVIFGGPMYGRALTHLFDPLFAGLTHPGSPQPIALTDAGGDGVAVRPAERPLQDLEPIGDLLTLTQARTEAYAGFHQGDGTNPDYFRREMLSSLSLARNPADRERALGSVARQLGGEFTKVELPDSQPLTMAAQSAAIPLIVENNAEGPRRLMLRFTSDKLVVAQHGEVVLIEPGVSSIDLNVEARSLGVSTLDVSLWTPDGSVQLAESSFQVRSTAIPGLSLFITLSAFTLMGVWWWLDSRRRKLAPTSVPDQDELEPDQLHDLELNAGSLNLDEHEANHEQGDSHDRPEHTTVREKRRKISSARRHRRAAAGERL